MHMSIRRGARWSFRSCSNGTISKVLEKNGMLWERSDCSGNIPTNLSSLCANGIRIQSNDLGSSKSGLDIARAVRQDLAHLRTDPGLAIYRGILS